MPDSAKRRSNMRNRLAALRGGVLDAAHIVMDANEQLGQPVVSNGLR
jgi:hypothetical protein